MQNYNLREKEPPKFLAPQGHQQPLGDNVYILLDLWFVEKLIYPIHALIFHQIIS